MPTITERTVEKLAIVSTTLNAVVESVERITNAIWGNGKAGLVDLTSQNQREIISLQRDILALQKSLSDFIQQGKAASDARTMEGRRFWASVIMLVLSSALALGNALMLAKIGVP